MLSDNSKWNNFLKEISNIIFFWFFSILFFLIYRLSFISIYSNEINWSNFSGNIFQALITGFRFDTMVTSYFIIVPLFASLITGPLNKNKDSTIFSLSFSTTIYFSFFFNLYYHN